MKKNNFSVLVFAVTAMTSSHAAAQTYTSSRGETVIVYQTPALYSSLFQVETIQWFCEDPVEIKITWTMREGRKMGVAMTSIEVAHSSVSQDIVDEIGNLAQSAYFKIYGLCYGDRPIALVNWAEEITEDFDREVGTATVHSRRIYLWPEASTGPVPDLSR